MARISVHTADETGEGNKRSRIWMGMVVFASLLLAAAAVAISPAQAQTPGFDWEQVGADIEAEEPGDLTGAVVAVSPDGNRIGIASPRNGNVGRFGGHVRIFERSGDSWVQLGANIEADDANDFLADSISFSADGNRVAVATAQGDYARVFDWTGTEWIQAGVDLGAGDFENPGAVAISADGNRLALGISARASINGISTGVVVVFDWTGTEWVEAGETIPGRGPGDTFGRRVAISDDGSRVAVGAPQLFTGGAADGLFGEPGTNLGYVQLFDWTGTEWVQVGGDINGDAPADVFGESVAISGAGDRVIIGGPQTFADTDTPGYARVFDLVGTEWVQAGADFVGEAAEDRFGNTVAISEDGNRIVIGGHLNDGNGMTAGHVRVFDWTGTQWAQAGTDIEGAEAFEQLGRSVAISADGTTVVAGAPLAGAARVFELQAIVPDPEPEPVVDPANPQGITCQVSVAADQNRSTVTVDFNDSSLRVFLREDLGGPSVWRDTLTPAQGPTATSDQSSVDGDFFLRYRIAGVVFDVPCQAEAPVDVPQPPPVQVACSLTINADSTLRADIFIDDVSVAQIRQFSPARWIATVPLANNAGSLDNLSPNADYFVRYRKQGQIFDRACTFA